MSTSLSVLRRAILAVLLVGAPACTAVFGVDFDDARPRMPDAARSPDGAEPADPTCGVEIDGTVACWGYDEQGQRDAPAGAFQQVSAGFGHTCALKGDATVTCWGDESGGQIAAPAGGFLQISTGRHHACAAPAGGFRQVSAGGAHTCGVRADGSGVCWGSNLNGQRNAPAGAFW